jgi:hypothetical protein
MSAQTDNGAPAPQTKANDKLVEVPNVDTYSTNFYVDITPIEGHTFSAQMTVRGGANGLDHIQRVLGAMRAIIANGGAAKTRGKAAQNGQQNGNGWEWGKAKNGRTVLYLREGQAEPDEVPCPVHDGKTFKRRVNGDGSWLTHRDGAGYCNAAFAKHP